MNRKIRIYILSTIDHIKRLAIDIFLYLKILDRDKYDQKLHTLASNHPERLAVLPYCIKGKGIDVGCGNRKSSDNCIGIDIVPKGSVGTVGSVTSQISQADICASGDQLSMFSDGELDFVIARHNLEHYVDVIKTIKEWYRVLRKDGFMVVVLPDETGLNRVGKRGVALDPTHEHSFTQESFKNLIEAIGGFEILKQEPVISNWSFISVCKKL